MKFYSSYLNILTTFVTEIRFPESLNTFLCVRFEVFMAVKIQVIFWVVMPCNTAIEYQHFRGPCCLHLQGEVNGTERKGIGIGLEYKRVSGSGSQYRGEGAVWEPVGSGNDTDTGVGGEWVGVSIQLL
jgi:hypothetical protein